MKHHAGSSRGLPSIGRVLNNVANALLQKKIIIYSLTTLIATSLTSKSDQDVSRSLAMSLA